MTLEENRKYKRDWCRKRRKIIFKNKACAICGSVKNLSIDHIIPRKISGKPKIIWSWSLEKIKKEINKHCQFLCEKHHKIKTASEHAVGEKVKNSVLKESDIKTIRLSKETCTFLAKKYNVNKITISRVKRNAQWKHIV
jgi:5-methylcytosine-specific restriction endonuclease McrA